MPDAEDDLGGIGLESDARHRADIREHLNGPPSKPRSIREHALEQSQPCDPANPSVQRRHVLDQLDNPVGSTDVLQDVTSKTDCRREEPGEQSRSAEVGPDVVEAVVEAGLVHVDAHGITAKCSHGPVCQRERRAESGIEVVAGELAYRVGGSHPARHGA
ncbi:MAG: hypothetical protein ACYCWW_08800 [Deltaproteobacteria bacterium]